MKLGRLLVRYLGVPLIAGKLSEADCQPLINKLTARIKSWTSKFLSIAGSFIIWLVTGSLILLPKKS